MHEFLVTPVISSQINMKRLYEIGEIIGLSSDEMDMYVICLLNNGSTAAGLALRSSLDRTKCYRLVAKLEEIGIVEKSASMPTKIYAKPPQEIMEMMILKKENELKTINDRGINDEFLKILDITSPIQNRSVFTTMISGYDNYVANMMKLIKKEKKCLIFVSEMAVKRGLFTNLSDIIKKTDAILIGKFPWKTLKRFNARHTKVSNQPFDFELVVTDNDVIIEVGDTKSHYSSITHEYRNYMHTNSPVIIHVLKSFMENLYHGTATNL